jgi:hypothetical protein
MQNREERWVKDKVREEDRGNVNAMGKKRLR